MQCVCFQIMNFQIVPAAGLIPQAAMPIYGAPASSQLLGQVVGAGGLIGQRPGQLPLLAAQGRGIAVTSPASQAALLHGIRQPLGQPTVAGGQAMLAGVPAAGARLIVPPSSQAMYMMHSLSGGAAAGAVIPGIDPASLMSSGAGSSADDSVLKSSVGSQQPDGKYHRPGGLPPAGAGRANIILLAATTIMYFITVSVLNKYTYY